MPHSLSNEFRVNEQVQHGQYTPRLVGLSNGNFVCAWDELRQTRPGELVSQWFARSFNGTGTPLGTQVNINSTESRARFWNNFVELKNGKLAFFWYSREAAKPDIQGRFFDNQLNAIGDEFPISSIGNGAERHPSAVELNDQSIAVAWIEGSGFNNSVQARVVDSDGRTVSLETRIDQDSRKRIHRVKLSHVGDNRFAVIWQEQSAESSAIKGQIFNRRMIPVGPQFYITDAGQAAGEHGTCEFPNSNFAVVWNEKLGRIGASIFSSNGTRIGSKIEVESDRVAGAFRPEMASRSDGTFVVAWSTQRTPSHVRARIYGPAGAPQGPAFQVNEPSLSNSGNVHISILKSGKFTIAWQAYSPESQTSDIFAKILTVT